MSSTDHAAALAELIEAISAEGHPVLHLIVEHCMSELAGDLAYEAIIQASQDIIVNAIKAHGVRLTACYVDNCAQLATMQRIALAYSPEDGVERDAQCCSASFCPEHASLADDEVNYLTARAFHMYLEAANDPPTPTILAQIAVVINDRYLRLITHVIERQGKLPRAD